MQEFRRRRPSRRESGKPKANPRTARTARTARKSRTPRSLRVSRRVARPGEVRSTAGVRPSVLILLLALGFLSGVGTSPTPQLAESALASGSFALLPPVSLAPPTTGFLQTADSTRSHEHDWGAVLHALPSGALDELDDGGLIAEYPTIAVDSIPMHQPRRTAGLVVVSRGELVRGQTLSAALTARGIAPETVQLLDRKMRPVFNFRRAQPGDRFRLSLSSQGDVLALRYWTSAEDSFHLFREGSDYVARAERVELTPSLARAEGVVQSSLYQTLQQLGEYPELAGAFAELFAWDIDFSRNVKRGDRFQILYEHLNRIDEDGAEVYVRPGRILAARYSGNAGDHAAVYFEDDSGEGSYYRADGDSVVKAFLAAPLRHTRISSHFSPARLHPILNVTRPHHGIDYAASEGTDIWSVANGTVIYRGWAGGFGNLVKVGHAGGYVSYYAHLSRFADGVTVGERVSQKQVLGFVGSTGLATGPHVCFRVAKNGHYVNPMRIKIPAGRPIADSMWGDFRIVRDTLLSALGPDPLPATEEAL